MLSKLLKHEFRATGRIMLPLYLVMIVLSFAANLSVRAMDRTEDTFLINLLGGLTLFAFVVGLFALCVMSVVLMINRFYTNLMSSEGYLMLTLPTSTQQLIFSKIIVSVVWFVATVLVCGLSCFFLALDGEVITSLSGAFTELFRMLQHTEAVTSMQVSLVILEGLLLAVAGAASFCLLVYAAIATGHSFNAHKGLLSFVFFFAYQFALQIFTAILGFSGITEITNVNLSAFAVSQYALLSMLAYALVLCVVFYFVTSVMMKKRLNLE